MNAITKKVTGLLTSPDDASSIATKAMQREKNAMCLVKAVNGVTLFIKEGNKIRRATDEEWDKYREHQAEHARKTKIISQ